MTTTIDRAAEVIARANLARRERRPHADVDIVTQQAARDYARALAKAGLLATGQMIPADAVRDIIACHRDGASHRGGMILDDLNALLPAPPRPTLADMTDEERDDCQWMQADVEGAEIRAVIVNPDWEDGIARALWPGGAIERVGWRDVTPHPDLPRMTWPGDTPTPTPATLTEGSEWGDIDALTTACETSGRGQIVVSDCDGDVSVWDVYAGWRETGLPSDGYEPYTIIHTGKKADQ